MLCRASFTFALFAALAIGCREDRSAATASEGAQTPASPPSIDASLAARVSASPAADDGTEAAGEQPPTPAPTTTAEAKLARHAECWGFVQNAQWTMLRSCFRDDSRWEILDGVPATAAQGRDEIVRALKVWRSAFPDLGLSQQLKLSNGDEIASIYILSGTHLGPFKGWPATRKRVGFYVAELATVGDDGTIALELLLFDERAIWHQIGVRPDPAAGEVVQDTRQDRPLLIAERSATEERNVKQIYSAIGVLGRRDANAYGAHLARSIQFRSYGDGVIADGKKAVLAALEEHLGSLVDSDNSFGRIWGAGNWVVAEVFATRTFRDRKVATNKELHFFRLADDKISEHHRFANELHTAWRRGQVSAEDLAPTTDAPVRRAAPSEDPP